MMNKRNQWLPLLVFFAILAFFFLRQNTAEPVHKTEIGSKASISQEIKTKTLKKEGRYYAKEEVAAYIHAFGTLPTNYITKKEAKEKNWSASDNNGYVIGGDRFGNREGKLPKKKGRVYYEADLIAGYDEHRGPERLGFSNDGAIYYTEDHYEHFEQLYGWEE